MHPILRSVLAVLAGAVVAFVLIAVIELLSGKLYPLHADPGSPEEMAKAMARAPVGALLLVLLGWAVGTTAGAWTAACAAGRSPLIHGIVVGALLLCAAVANLLSFPHPIWFWIAAVALFLPCAYLGSALAERREPPA
ncbi:MAG TPA: hypothetical protein VGX68_25975 [Thermoanaerobaculia bacterium]|jgi:hypothetical protein|nr:hypothetical protein [Thermoanaerobaculia bacterium]